MDKMIYKKMSEVMNEIGAVKKNQNNVSQGFKFRGIDDMVNALYPALTKYNVFMTPRAISYTQDLKEVVRSSGKTGVDKHVAIMMEYDFWAEDGSKVTVGPIPAEGLDSGDKATNKALSAALKYALIQTFSVPTEDMAEADLESPELGQTKTKKTPLVPNIEDLVGATLTGILTESNTSVDSVQATLRTETTTKTKPTTGSFRKPKNNSTTTVTASTNGVTTSNGTEWV